MKRIQLPVMPSSTDLGTAIDILKKFNRGALLAEHNGQYHLCSAGNIVSGRKKGLNRLSDLSPESILSIGNRLPDVGLEQVTGSDASVEFSHNEVADRYVSSPKDYYCDGPRHHDDFPPPNVSEGDDCPHGDGYKIIST